MGQLKQKETVAENGVANRAIPTLSNTASTRKISPSPSARVLKPQKKSSLRMRLLCCAFSLGALVTRSWSQGLPLTESAQHLAVIGEAMLRLVSLLRTNHMLGGTKSSDLSELLSLGIAEIYTELTHSKD